MLRVPGTALGFAFGDICKLIPTNYIPGLRDVVARIGCTGAARAVLQSEIGRVVAASQGGPAGVFAGVLTNAVLAECLCKGQASLPPPPPPPPPWYHNPWLIGGAAVAGLGLFMTLARPRRVPSPEKEGSR